MEMTGITRGSLGWLTITVLVLVVISPTTAGEEHQPAEVHQGPPSLQQRVARGTGEKKKNVLKKKKKSGRAKNKKKPRNKNLKNKSKKSRKQVKDEKKKLKKSKKKTRGKKGSKTRRKNKKTKRNKKKKADKKKKKKGRVNKRRRKGNGKRNKRKRKNQRKNKKLRQSSSCQNISCLNNLLQVLKIDKDTVQNFMQQKKRIDKKLSLATSKQGKSNATGLAVASLQKSLGGAEALKNNRPVCHGRYNITDAIQGQVMYNNISQCDSQVKAACNFSMPANETAEVEACNKVMGDFR